MIFSDSSTNVTKSREKLSNAIRVLCRLDQEGAEHENHFAELDGTENTIEELLTLTSRPDHSTVNLVTETNSRQIFSEITQTFCFQEREFRSSESHFRHRLGDMRSFAPYFAPLEREINVLDKSVHHLLREIRDVEL